MTGGLAERDGRLKFGDELLALNGSSFEGLTHQEAVNLLRSCQGEVRFKIARLPGSQLDDGSVSEVETLTRSGLQFRMPVVLILHLPLVGNRGGAGEI
jgi:C-terminal processing protease CtpA/Prc